MRKSNIIHSVGIGRKAMSYWKFGLSFADGLFRKIILLINYSNPFLYFFRAGNFSELCQRIGC